MESSPSPTINGPPSPRNLHDKKGDTTNAASRPASNEGAEEVDAVWGKLDGNSPNYKSLSWVRAAIIMIKSQVSQAQPKRMNAS